MAGRNSKNQDLVIHDYDYKINNTWNLIKRDLSNKDARLIEKYDNLMTNQALAKATRLKHLQIILNLSRLLKKNWNDIKSSDVDKLVSKIMQLYGDKNGQESNTSWDHKKILKIFVRWFRLGSREFREVGDPPETKRVKLRKVKDKIVREDLLTDDDLSRLLYACGSNLRDKALLACHYEAGTRPGEILSLKVKHVKFDENGAVIHVDGKTGPRSIRLVSSSPHLAKWLDSHPLKDNSESPLWILFEKNNFGKPLTYSAARKLLDRIQEKAELQKHVNLNRFRHSAATNCAKFMTEAQMRKRHGWTPYSKMPGRYVHLVNADVDEAIFDHYGIEKTESHKIELPQKCIICEMLNSAESKTCSKCGRPLNIEAALEIEEHDKTDSESRLHALEKQSINFEQQFRTEQEQINHVADLIKDLQKKFEESLKNGKDPVPLDPVLAQVGEC